MSLGPDQMLDSDHDLLFVNGDRVMVISLSQAIKIALQFFLGEWFLDGTVGLPFLQLIFRKPFLEAQTKSLLRSEIEAVPGVIDVTGLEMELDPETRLLSIRWAALGEEGAVNGDLEVEL